MDTRIRRVIFHEPADRDAALADAMSKSRQYTVTAEQRRSGTSTVRDLYARLS